MSTRFSAHATATRSCLCPHCHGQGEMTLEHPGGTFDPCLEQWFPDASTYPCALCDHQGTVTETYCLLCKETLDDCYCTDEQLEAFLILRYLGAA